MARNKGLLVALLTGIVTGAMWGSPAQAQDGHLPEPGWVANGQSEVINSTTIKLQDHVNGDTSVENPSVGLNVQSGAEVSVEYELKDGATCQSGEPRLFAFVNGALNKSDLCDGTGDDSASGTLSFEAASSGLVTQVGMVYSRDVGHVIMRNLVVDGTPVLFLEPPAQPAPSVEFTDNCEGIAANLSNSEDATTDAEFLVPINPSSKLDKIIVEPAGSVQVFIGAFGESITVTEDVTGQEFTHTWAKPAEGCEKGTEPSPEPSDTAAPPAVGKGGELAQTGAPLPLLGGAGLLLLMLGAGALLLARRRGGVNFTT